MKKKRSNNNVTNNIISDKSDKAVFSIDAGRKYFSEEKIKKLIDHAYINGYTDVQLILANDGNRFFLDDMTITTSQDTYSSEDVKKALTAGNNNYYQDPNGNALTESEMDKIISFAKERDIGIIPLINSPGHMDSILDAMEILGIESPHYKVSKRTVSLKNKKALEFTKVLIDRYAEYFSSYSEIFNIGADEYANDVDTAGWSGIQRSGLYKDFVIYINDLADIVQNYDMRPMVYNDGIYYNGDKSFGEFDTGLIIAYWTAGWGELHLAEPELFLDKGHDVISSNSAWYWVLGNYTSEDGDGIFHLEDFYNKVEGIPFMTIPGKSDSTIPVLGSIHSIWSDDPSKTHDLDIIFGLMDKFSDTHSEFMEKPIVNEDKN